MVIALTARVQELEARLAKNSSNSSRPPSSDPPGTTRPRRERSKRNRGGQPGHPKHTRELVPIEEVSEVVPLKPTRCRRCKEPLFGSDAAPHRHQITELPKVKATVTEYQLHRLSCAHCHTTTRAELPPGVPRGRFGRRLGSLVAVASGVYRLPKRLTELLLSDVCGVEISLGSVSNLEAQVSAALEASVEEARDYIQKQPVVHADETGWREAKKKAWLWMAATATVAVFLIRRSRGSKVAKELLGDKFEGCLVSDRWNGYGWIATLRRQLCWAHLIRDFESFRDWGRGAKCLATQLLRPTKKIFEIWKRVRDGTMDQATFEKETEPLRRNVVYHLRRGADWRVAKVAGKCREILKLKDALWTFATVPGVEPTNNHGERCLRHAVLWRNVSFGTDSERGSRFVERMLTVATTLRLQKRNVLDYVTAACEAHALGKPAPSLLPERSDYNALPLAA